MTATIATGDIFDKLFLQCDVEIRGTVNDPLFNARHLSVKIDDPDYARALNKFDPADIVHQKANDAAGHKVDTLFLTEIGLYKYLLRSKRPLAQEFQRWVFNTLKAIRLQVVDEAKLRAKIIEDEAKRKIRIVDEANRRAFQKITDLNHHQPWFASWQLRLVPR